MSKFQLESEPLGVQTKKSEKNSVIIFFLIALIIILLVLIGYVFKCQILNCPKITTLPPVQKIDTKIEISSESDFKSLHGQVSDKCAIQISETGKSRVSNLQFSILSASIFNSDVFTNPSFSGHEITSFEQTIHFSNLEISPNEPTHPNDFYVNVSGKTWENGSHPRNFSGNLFLNDNEITGTLRTTKEQISIFPLGNLFHECESDKRHYLKRHVIEAEQRILPNENEQNTSPEQNSSIGANAVSEKKPEEEWRCNSSEKTSFDHIFEIPKSEGHKPQLIFRALLPNNNPGECPNATKSTELCLREGYGKTESNLSNNSIRNIETFTNMKLNYFCDGQNPNLNLPKLNIFGNLVNEDLCKTRKLPNFFYRNFKFENSSFSKAGYTNEYTSKFEPCSHSTSESKEECLLSEKSSIETLKILEQGIDTPTILPVSGELQHVDRARKGDLVIYVIFQPIDDEHTQGGKASISGKASNIGQNKKRNWVVLNNESPILAESVLIHEVGHLFGVTHGTDDSPDKKTLLKSIEGLHPTHQISGSKIYSTAAASGGVSGALFKQPEYSPISDFPVIVLPSFSEKNLMCVLENSDVLETSETPIMFCDEGKQSNNLIQNLNDPNKTCKTSEFYLREIAISLKADAPVYAEPKILPVSTVSNVLEQGDILIEDNSCPWDEGFKDDELILLKAVEFEGLVQKEGKIENSKSPIDLNSSQHSILVIGSASFDSAGRKFNLKLAKDRAESFAKSEFSNKLLKGNEVIRVCSGINMSLPNSSTTPDEIQKLQNSKKFAAAYLYPNTK